MLYILFSPSEGKKTGGTDEKLTLFGGLDEREEILHAYDLIVRQGNEEEIKKLFGFKNFSQCEPYINDIHAAPTLKAIERYDGVAYDYLQYPNLDSQSQSFLDERLIIFSNLFGPVFANDRIPVYKVKQGNPVGDIYAERFYNERFSDKLDRLLQDHDILDLRAGYYDKFYKITQPYTILKFLKNGKIVSHWAKAYRGIVAREIAKSKVDSLKEFSKLQIPSLVCEEIKTVKNKTEIIYKIVE